MKKGILFFASVRCPKCGKAMKMRVSDLKDYAYQCLDCDEDFYSFECPETVCDYQNEAEEFAPLYEITLHGQSANWYKEHKNTLDELCNKYNIAFMGCDDGGNKSPDEEAFIDFGWEAEEPEDAPNAKMIQDFTDEVMRLIA